MASYLEKDGRHAGAWFAEDVLERDALDQANEDAYINATEDVIARNGGGPDPTEAQQRYIDAYVEGFVKTFRAQYANAYRSAYKHVYPRRYAEVEQEQREQELTVV